MEQHQQFRLGAFSCVPVEKKNHDQVSAFFQKTMKDGGKGAERKSAIVEILDYENCLMYFTHTRFILKIYKFIEEINSFYLYNYIQSLQIC